MKKGEKQMMKELGIRTDICKRRGCADATMKVCWNYKNLRPVWSDAKHTKWHVGHDIPEKLAGTCLRQGDET